MIHKIGDGRLAAERQIDAVKVARAHAGQGKGRFAQRLAGNGARVGSRASKFVVIVDQRDAFSERSGRCSADDAGGAAANHDEIIRLNAIAGHVVLILKGSSTKMCTGLKESSGKVVNAALLEQTTTENPVSRLPP